MEGVYHLLNRKLKVMEIISKRLNIDFAFKDHHQRDCEACDAGRCPRNKNGWWSKQHR